MSRLNENRPGAYAVEIYDCNLPILSSHFWFVGRTRVIQAAVERCVPPERRNVFVELGAGTGHISAALADKFKTVVGTDYLNQGIGPASRRYKDSGVHWAIMSAEQPALSGPVDAIGLFDVIEHLDDERTVLNPAAELLGPGGHIIITVPALPALWSLHDEQAGHRRRYWAKGLAALMAERFDQLLLTYFMATPLPLMAFQRAWLGLRRGRSGGRDGVRDDQALRQEVRRLPPKIINGWLLDSLSREAAQITTGRGYRLGSSLLYVGRKKG